MSRLFITAVGTGVGKTLMTTLLCRQLRALGRTPHAIKPVVSGYVDDDPAGDTALIAMSLGRQPTPSTIAALSPWRFAAPLAPPLAARLEGRHLLLAEVAAFCRGRDGSADAPCLIEGAGGIMSPIADDGTCLDLIVSLRDPAILMTGSYLGAISHTLTAVAAARAAGVTLRGIVVSESADSVGLVETVASLRHYGGEDLTILTLPRLAGGIEDRWRAAPPLVELCEPPR